MQQVVSRKEAKEKGLKHYFTGKHCKHGHVAERRVSGGGCCVCARKRYEQNKEEFAEYNRKHYEQNKEKISEQARKYREQNKERIAEYCEQNKEYIAERARKYYRANPEQAFIRNSLSRILTNWKGGRAKAEKLLGYTCEQLRSHIESKFKDGMSWDNRSEWHIDHEKPVSVFIKEGITDPAIINALDNLQPLWAHENLSKHAKWDGQ